jgi:uncharacterized protein (DUF58 family)
MASASHPVRVALRGLTRRGEGLLAAGVTTVVLSIVIGQTDLLRVGLLVCALPLISAVAVLRSRFRLASSRRLHPRRIEAGQEARIVVRLDNVGALPTGLMLVQDQVPESLGARPRFVLDRLEPRGRREVEYTVHAPARGRYTIGPLQITVTDPFRLCESHRSFATQDLLVVTPTIEPLPTLILGGDWSGSGESRSRSVAAAGEDDVAVREYRHGDELRRVHWKATAKFGDLMVRREEQPWESRCSLLVDLRAAGHRGVGASSSFERAVSAAASVGVHLGRHGYTVNLVTPGSPDIISAGHQPATSGGDNEGLLLDALAVVEPVAGEHLEALADALRHASGTLVVAVLGHITPDDAAALVRARHADAGAVAIVLDVADWLPEHAPQRPTLRAQSDGACTLLRSSGWRVVTLDRRAPLASRWPTAGRGGQAVSATTMLGGVA